MRSILRRAVGVVLLGVVTSCTFGGLGDYDIVSCNPNHQSQQEDECDRLNKRDPATYLTTCQPFQCDKVTQRCIQKTRDDDRDGHPPTHCGGSDCEDENPLNGGSSESCDGHDNNCNGLVDDGVAYTGAPPQSLLQNSPSLGAVPNPSITVDASGVVGAVIATTATGSECIDVFALESGQLLGNDKTPCSFLADNQTLAPRQPAARRLAGGGAGTAVAFSATSGCSPGALGYRWFEPPASTGKFDLPCPTGMGLPAKGAALPIVEDLGQNELALFFYDTPVGSRDAVSTTTNCSTLASAPLLSMVTGYGATMPGPIVHITDGIATAPAATASVPGLGALVVAPVAKSNGASAFLVGPTGTPGEIALAGFDNARAAAVALGPSDAQGRYPVAIVGELGCAPQTLVAAFGTLDVGAKSLKMGDAAPVSVAAAGGSAIRPAVAWQNKVTIGSGERTEWLVTWTATGAEARGRRFDGSGAPLSPEFSLGQGLELATPGLDGRVYGVDIVQDSFQGVTVLCPPG